MSEKTPDLSDQIKEERILRNLEEMVAIPSVVGDEDRLTNYLGDRLAEIGIEPTFQTVEGDRKNVYAILNFGRPGPLITLNGHSDTVPAPEGWSGDPFRPRREGNKLFGLGSCDMKGGLAIALETIRALKETAPTLAGAAAFSAVVDEEGFSAGAKALLNTPLKESAAILIGEPFFGIPESTVPLGITGKVLYEITAKGLSAHGFSPEDGVNAVEEMARLLSSLPELPVGEAPQFGKGNVCTLKVEGGYKKYAVTVPDRCRAVINRLLVPGETVEDAIAEMEEFIAGLDLDSKFEVKGKPPTYSPISQNKEEEIFKIFGESYRQAFNRAPCFGFHKSIMDANVFVAGADIPTLVFGPRGERLHGPNEFVHIDTLKPVAETYLSIIQNFLSCS